MHETLTYQTIKLNRENSARDTNVTKNQTQHREHSARDTNVTNNLTEQRE